MNGIDEEEEEVEKYCVCKMMRKFHNFFDPFYLVGTLFVFTLFASILTQCFLSFAFNSIDVAVVVAFFFAGEMISNFIIVIDICTIHQVVHLSFDVELDRSFE